MTNSASGECLGYKEAKKKYDGKYLVWKSDNGKKCWGLRPQRLTTPNPIRPLDEPEDVDDLPIPVPFINLFLKEAWKPPPEYIIINQPEIGPTDIEQASVWPPLEEEPTDIPRLAYIVTFWLLSFGLGALVGRKIR